MENKLSFDVKLSLKEISLRRVAVNLWNEPDVLSSIEKFCPKPLLTYFDSSEKWRGTVESKVTGKLSRLVIPELVRNQILYIIPPIGLQIKNWKDFHENYLKLPRWERILEKYLAVSHVEFGARILAKLCWTAAGKVDYRKTAEKFIICDVVDIVKRYQLACLYCLDAYIPALWKDLPKEIKGKFYDEEDTSEVITLNLPFCWPYIVHGEQSKLDRITAEYCRYSTFHQHAFKYSARSGNKSATEYFFRKLTQEEKKDSFISGVIVEIFGIVYTLCFDYTFPSENFCDVVYYLLSHMNYEQQIEILKMPSCCVLLSLRDWPCQDLFLKNADLIWAFLPAGDYDRLMDEVIYYFKKSRRHFPKTIAKFFQEFFRNSPIDFRNKFVERECRKIDLLDILFCFEDSDTVKVIFSNIDAADRVRIVSCRHTFERFYPSVLDGRTQMVELFLREATPSKEDVERLKKTYLGFLAIDEGQSRNSKRPVWVRFRHLLDEISASAESKRSLEDVTLNNAKRLCSSE